MNAIAEIKRLPETKEQLISFINAVKQEVIEGNINPLDLDIRLKYVEEMVKGIRKDAGIKEAIIDEVSKYGKGVERANCEIKISTKTTFEYKEDYKVKELEKELKERKAFLKSITIVVFDENGIEIYPMPTKQSEIITYKLK